MKMKAENNAANPSGSALVPGAGVGVPPSRTFPDAKPAEDTLYFRRRLPHFERPWAIYAVTIVTKLRRCLSPDARTIVLNALRHFHNTRYELFAACVMPGHVHLLMQPWPKENDEKGNVVFWSLSDLLHSINSFSAHQMNKLEHKTGGVWEKERFDRYVRSDCDLQEKFHYILRNLWDAGVAGPNEDYPWVWTQDDELRKESSSRPDSATNTRDARATQSTKGDAP